MQDNFEVYVYWDIAKRFFSKMDPGVSQSFDKILRFWAQSSTSGFWFMASPN